MTTEDTWSAVQALEFDFNELRYVAELARQRMSLTGSKVISKNDAGKYIKNTFNEAVIELEKRSTQHSQITKLLQSTAIEWRAEEVQATEAIKSIMTNILMPTIESKNALRISNERVLRLKSLILQLSDQISFFAVKEEQIHKRLRECELAADQCINDSDQIPSLLAKIDL